MWHFYNYDTLIVNSIDVYITCQRDHAIQKRPFLPIKECLVY